jgi:hypothetical protein
MTIESELANIDSSVAALITQAVLNDQQIDAAVALFAATTAYVNARPDVENYSALTLPLSSAAVTALAGKQPSLVSGVSIATINGVNILTAGDIQIARSATSLSAVAYDDRSTLRALSPEVDDSTVIEGLGLFMWVATTDEPDDDETCFTTASGQWLLAVPAQDLLDAWARPERALRDAYDEDENKRFETYLIETGR